MNVVYSIISPANLGTSGCGSDKAASNVLVVIKWFPAPPAVDPY